MPAGRPKGSKTKNSTSKTREIICLRCKAKQVIKISAGTPKKFCSKKCQELHRKETRAAFKIRTCAKCGKVFETQNNSHYCSLACSRAVLSERAKEKAQKFTCKKCGKEFTRVRRTGDTKDPVYCSRRCSGNGEVGKATTKVYKGKGSYRRRAKFYGVDYEPVKIMGIFAKHKWTCQICGCPTPESQRGTKCDNAPEIDHIIPLSRGGSHTESNLQNTCRKCNREKGSTI